LERDVHDAAVAVLQATLANPDNVAGIQNCLTNEESDSKLRVLTWNGRSHRDGHGLALEPDLERFLYSELIRAGT
jgi:hypothetical protein